MRLINVSTAVAGATATSFAAAGVTPTVQYHLPSGSSVTTQNITYAPLSNPSVVTSISDMTGLAAATNGANAGPLLLTDAAGRRFARFTNDKTTVAGANNNGPNGPNYLDIAANGTLASVGSRNISVFMVGRAHRSSVSAFLSLNGVNPGGPVIGTSPGNSGSTPFLRSGSRYASAPLSGDASRMVVGSQLEVIGVASRTGTQGTANGGTRQYVNADTAMNQSLTNVTGTTGLRIGDSAVASFFDLYEMVVFVGQLTDAQADAVAAALVANWSIPAITDQIVLEGDSITAGVTTDAGATGVFGGWNLGMALSDPNAKLVPATTRIVSMGVSGAKLVDLITRRDVANSIYTTGKLASGRNIVAVQVGRNDWDFTAASGTAEYQGLTGTGADTTVGLIYNSSGTGYLQRGWEVAQAINMASGLPAASAQQRSLLRAASFLTDVQAGSGQTYAGKLTRLELALISTGGVLPFDTETYAGGTIYYQGDGTHPNRQLGTSLMASGGDTPQYGYGSIL